MSGSLFIKELHIDKTPGFDAAKTRAEDQADTTAFLTEYRKARRGRRRTGEEMFELRANHPAGSTVVDVSTGRRTKL